MRRLFTFLALSLLAIGLLAGASFSYSYFTRPVLDATLKAQAPGRFIELSHGSTHYELSGAEDGELVVLVHGLSSPMIIWDKTVDALRAGGKRVLRYDLYGRGYSERVPGPYDIELFDTQLRELLDRLGARGAVDFVGLSMGAATVTIFASRYPQRVRSLSLIAPLSVPLPAQSWLTELFRGPYLGDYLAEVFGDEFILDATLDEFINREAAASLLEQLEPQTRIRGTAAALLDTARRLPDPPRVAAYEALALSQHPVLIIWGTKDQTLPFRLSEQLRELLPRAAFLAVPEAGHSPHYERPERVNPVLLDFLKAPAARPPS